MKWHACTEIPRSIQQRTAEDQVPNLQSFLFEIFTTVPLAGCLRVQRQDKLTFSSGNNSSVINYEYAPRCSRQHNDISMFVSVLCYWLMPSLIHALRQCSLMSSANRSSIRSNSLTTAFLLCECCPRISFMQHRGYCAGAVTTCTGSKYTKTALAIFTNTLVWKLTSTGHSRSFEYFWDSIAARKRYGVHTCNIWCQRLSCLYRWQPLLRVAT